MYRFDSIKIFTFFPLQFYYLDVVNMAVSDANCAIFLRGMKLLQYCFYQLYLKLTSLFRHFFSLADFSFVLEIVFLAVIFRF